MYAYILGVISEIQPTNVVLDNQGIGYLIVTPNPYIYKLGENVKMYIHHHVREDQDTLYGFDTKESRNLFEVFNQCIRDWTEECTLDSRLGETRPNRVRHRKSRRQVFNQISRYRTEECSTDHIGSQRQTR